MRWNLSGTMAVALLTVGCADGGETTEDTGLADLTDAEIAEQIWTEIADYESWGRFDAQSDTPVQSADHMGMFVVSYYSSDTLAWDLDGDAPDGAVAVKEIYMSADAEAPMGFTVMRKVAGYAPEAGDWFWADYGADGTVNAAGAIDMCLGCHSQSNTDYVFGR